MRRRSKHRDGSAAAGPIAAEAEQLLAAGIFDQGYYEAQVDRTFPSPKAAAAHYLSQSSGRHSPHPLIDLSYFGTWFITRLRSEPGARVLLERLRSKAVDRALGPLFDARELDDAPELLAAHLGGALGHFLETKGPHAPLPGREGQTLASARPHLIAAARQNAGERGLRRPRVQDSWDEGREHAWKRRSGSAPLPEGDGPLVSVIMPVRNRPQRVVHAVASVQAQVLDRWELLVVDDGSTDETAAVLDDLARDDPRIRVFRQDWAGVCAARNRGLSEARADYVAFLDSDNMWRSDFLRLALAAVHAQGLSAAYAAQSLNNGGEVSYRAHDGTLDDLMVANHVDLNVMVVRTALARQVGGFDESLRRWVDHDFAIRVAEVAPLRLLPFIGVDYDDERLTTDRITTTEPDSWQFVVLGKHWVKWDEVRAAAPSRVPGRVSIVIPTWNDAKMTARAVQALVRNTPDIDLEIVVVDNGSKPDVALSLVASTFDEPQVRIERLPRNLNFAIGSNLGFARSTGETVVFLNNDTEPRPGWLAPLLAALEDPEVLGAQPLLLYPDDSIQACGTAFPVAGHLPVHMLVGHPPEDARRMKDTRFAVVTAAALAMRSSDVLALEGFDPMFVNGMEDVDLCLRAAQHRPGHFVVVNKSQVTHHEGKTAGRSTAIPTNRKIFMDRWGGRLPDEETWRWKELGFEIAHISGDGVEVPTPRLLIIRPAAWDGDAERPLRWGLRSPAVGGEIGDLWGDTHFLRSLSRGLGRLGQEVVTYRHGTHSDPATAYDDVVLGVRGLDRIAPVPGKVNVLWVISHPDMVTPAEVRAFDLVYAASPTWAARMSVDAGREVRVLLQATDAELRADMSRPIGDGRAPLFVGGAPRDRGRPIVEAALTSAIPIAVYGPFWEGKIPDELHLGSYVPNTELMQLYRDHGLVLADHWDDMREEGFLANRLFDAVASGARVVSDPVPGLDLFGGAVQPFHSEDELELLCSPAGRERFPDDKSMARIADRIVADHSFDARSEVLLRDVRAVLADRKPTAP